ncbi:MAG: IPTL-CTERM sorting domain-containing protein [Betaproteobacteria bacterium]|nr:IPTL-CTERM sorting domain-containing protein [Betaproteobacteria bacterium]
MIPTIPTLSEWALLVMAGLLVLVSLWALLRRRNGRMG